MQDERSTGAHFHSDDDEDEEDEDDEDDDEKPMGIEEFKARVMHGKMGKHWYAAKILKLDELCELRR